jgi:Mg-chelatase subunit ChlD
MYLKTVPLLVSVIVLVQCKPQNLVITTTTTEGLGEQIKITEGDIKNFDPKIAKFHVTSNIQFRYAQTQVVSYVKNPGSEAKEISFTAVIPDSAFISNFSMVLKGKEYVAQVKAKEEAKKEYDEAVTLGRGAGLVSQDARDANKFTVATNVEPGQKVEFKLTYEELLERKLGQYEHVININPGQIVEDLKIEVFIDESLPIKSLSVPELKESNDVDFEENQESEIAKVEKDVDGDSSKAHITFAPDRLYQEEAGEQGLSGQLLIKYDVDRKNQANEIEVIDGYFVHYFAPEDLPTLPKHVIFVLDISGSMSGEKINQLKDAMFTILDDMTDRDFFNIITFSSGVSHWNPKLEIELTTSANEDFNPNFDVQGEQFVIEATDKNKKDAIKHILDINAGGGTNINDGLLEGLNIAKFARQNEKLPADMQSILVFLSDGQPSSGVTNGKEITGNVRKANILEVPIYSLGFGRDADFGLIKEISADSDAFSKQIYEGSDAAIQLENFFAEISSPLLSDLKFSYVGGLVDNSSISKPQVRTFFRGAEFVVAGKLEEFSSPENDVIDITVSGDGRHGKEYLRKLHICLRPRPIPDISNNTELMPLEIEDPDQPLVSDISPDSHRFCIYPAPPPRSQAQNFLQKLHAFLNIKQLLKQMDKVDIKNDKSVKEKALNLALENNFVTELTSLLVIRPDEEPKISNLKQSNPQQSQSTGFSAFNRVAYSSFSAPAAPPSGSAFSIRASVPQNIASKSSIQALKSNLSTFRKRRPSTPRRPISQSLPKQKTRRPLPTTTTSRAFTTTTTTTPLINGTNYEGEKESLEIVTEIDLQNSGPSTCSGNITLFDKTYLRGESVSFNEDTDDLGEFNDKLVSVEVQGNCCWTVFTELGYNGLSHSFIEGKFKSLVQVGDVFRDGSSLRKTDVC